MGIFIIGKLYTKVINIIITLHTDLINDGFGSVFVVSDDLWHFIILSAILHTIPIALYYPKIIFTKFVKVIWSDTERSKFVGTTIIEGLTLLSLWVVVLSKYKISCLKIYQSTHSGLKVFCCFVFSICSSLLSFEDKLRRCIHTILRRSWKSTIERFATLDCFDKFW